MRSVHAWLSAARGAWSIDRFIFWETELLRPPSLLELIMAEVAAAAAMASAPSLKKKQAVVPIKKVEAKEKEKDRPQVDRNELKSNSTSSTSKEQPKPTTSQSKPRLEAEAKEETEAPATTESEKSNANPSVDNPTITSLLTENASLQSQLTTLKTALHDAQNHIFSLQPHTQTLTNSDAINAFQSLHTAIETWVDQYLADSLDEKQVAVDALHVDDIQNLMNLIPFEAKAAFTNVAGTDVDIIQAVILRFLVESIFNQDFYTPLPRGEREFVMGVERAMRVLEPRRDIRTIRHWHIETYTAASSRPGFDTYAQDRMWSLTVHMVKMLRAFAPSTDPNTLAKSFLESITKPAAELARRFHLCFDEYALEWSGYHDSEKTAKDGLGVFEREVRQGRFGEWDFVRVGEGGKYLREVPMVEKGKGEGYEEGEEETKVKVRWLFDMAPRLVFRKLKVDSWGEGKVLVKPRVLVRVSEQKRVSGGSAKKVVKKAAGEEYKTVLGAVQGWLQRQEYYLEKERERKEKEKALGKQVGGFFGNLF
ncbi:uncharacterized protein DSM5745_07962 [Aspergillus mulundensis]|uniref:Uncharacterized protein n=1 Tax=Aspergillus mulundensis TaxID=1810919 RepID=A0A3D8R989_9EURO|nr:Uncharacterized protein DSM5745_07962 [Aspergillus mulundensis]RDW70451.1 Uncharacterized protein DSM5745_07962 [Aspergillus mulundensis]